MGSDPRRGTVSETIDAKLLQKLTALEERSRELSRRLAEPEITADRQRYRETSRAYAELQPIIEKLGEYRKVAVDLEGARELLTTADEAELKTMAGHEVRVLEDRLRDLDAELRALLIPSDPNDEKNVVLEVRAGTGGDEATLFASEIFRMYQMFAEQRGWRVRVLRPSGR